MCLAFFQKEIKMTRRPRLWYPSQHRGHTILSSIDEVLICISFSTISGFSVLTASYKENMQICRNAVMFLSQTIPKLKTRLPLDLHAIMSARIIWWIENKRNANYCSIDSCRVAHKSKLYDTAKVLIQIELLCALARIIKLDNLSRHFHVCQITCISGYKLFGTC